MSTTSTKSVQKAGGAGAGGTAQAATAAKLARLRRQRDIRRRWVIGLLAAAVLLVVAVSLCVGQTSYSPAQVWQVLTGEQVPGASFAVGVLRVPRTVMALVAGLSFGLAGVTFQTMLRNPLASPDIIGISSGASAAAAIAIIALSASGAVVSTFAITAGLGVALLVYVLAYKGGAAGTRLILVGIGIAAMLDSVINYLLTQAGQWDLQVAMRWLTGSLNGTTWNQVIPALLGLLVLAPVLLGQHRNLSSLQLGDDTAAGLGVRIERTRLLAIIAAVGLVSFATAATGPIAFVAFLSGPIAARILGPRGSLLLPAALVGALLVLVGDFCGQYLLPARYPVGIVTGILGAPYLIYLIIRSNRSQGAL